MLLRHVSTGGFFLEAAWSAYFTFKIILGSTDQRINGSTDQPTSFLIPLTKSQIKRWKGERETEKQSEVEAEQKPGEEMVTEKPMFETKNTESLIPKKRKLVKTMMLEDMMDSIATLLANCWGGGEAEPPKRAKHTAGKNGKKIFPVQPWYLWSTHCSQGGVRVYLSFFYKNFQSFFSFLFCWMIPFNFGFWLWFWCLFMSF